MTFAQPFKDYEILERIGSGAMGTVFKARQKRLDRIVALKVLKPSLARNKSYVERLKREARIVASLNHPDIVAGYDLGEEGGYHFFVMEYVEGRSLAALLKEWGSFPEEQVLEVAVRVASALDHAFAKGVIHRDIKPGNILIDAAGRAKLTDMGLAKAPEDAALTQDGATVGTPQYISPEQVRDPGKADIRSDLYSLGATLFHMATGQPPFGGTSLAKVIHDVMHVRPPSAVALNPSLTDGLNLVIRKLLAKDPDRRYQTPAELLADLQRVRRAERPAVDEHALAAAEGGPPAAPARRWPWAGLAAAGVLAAIAIVAWPGEQGGGSPADPSVAFTAELSARLAASEGYRAKLQLLAQARAAAASAAEERAVADLRSGMLISWQEALVALVRARREGLDEWILVAEHWRDPAGALRREVLAGIERRFQISGSELPAPLPQALEAELAALAGEAEAKAAQRDAAFAAAFADHLEREAGPAWRARLEAQDFAGAEQALRGAVAAFFGAEGRPRREQLGEALLARIASMEEAMRQEAGAQVEQAETAAAGDLLRVAQQVLAGFREQLRAGDDPRLVQADAERWRRELAARHPGAAAFRAGRDPWRRLDELESAFRTELVAALRRADQRRFAGNLQLALAALLADGDARQELGWLREQAAGDEAVARLREQAAAVVGGALQARDWLLGALLQHGEGRPLAVSDPGSLARTLQVTVRRDGDRFELVERDGGRTRRVSLASVRVSEVLEAAKPGPPPAADAQAIARGLALWLYLANESSVAAARLDPEVEGLFRDHIVPAVQLALRRRLGDDVDARAALARLRDYRNLPTAALGDALAGFQSRFAGSELAAANAQFLDDVRSHLQGRRQRESMLAALRAAVPAPLAVALGDGGEAMVTCEPGGCAALPLGAGWSRSAERFEFAGAEPGLGNVREHALVVEDALSTEHAVRAQFGLALPPQGSRPRLYLFEVHGVGIALGLAGDGTPVAAVVGVEDLAREAVLQPRLEAQLDSLVAGRAPPAAVPGARHELEVEVRVQPQRLAARVLFDGVELAAGSLARPPRTAARAVILPMHALRVYRVCVVGRP